MYVAIAIAVGGAVGSLARHFLSGAVQGAAGGNFPWGILAVNIIGGFAMGLVVEAAALRYSLAPEMRAFLTTGILGGFTTFSTFSLDTALMLERGDILSAAAYVTASVGLSVTALFLGLWLVRTIL
jgi:CrcB protein